MRRGKRWTALALFGVSVLRILAPSGVLSAEDSYGRACLVVEDMSSNDPLLITTTVLGERSTPGSGKRVALYADANVDAYVFAAVFNDTDRRLTNGWRPQGLALRAGEEQRLPREPIRWEWTSSTGPFEAYAVFLSHAAREIESLQALVSAMQDPKADPALLDLQAKKLYEALARFTAQEPAAFHGGAVPGAWGGTLRGEPFPWPKMAQKTVIGANGRGVLIYRHGR